MSEMDRSGGQSPQITNKWKGSGFQFSTKLNCSQSEAFIYFTKAGT
jgi:hypothetical protein